MSRLAGLLAGAAIESNTPTVLATVDPTGRLDVAASGTWSNGRPVLPDDSFYGASLAKQVTGTAVALLVRDDRLDPDAPIATYQHLVAIAESMLDGKAG